MRPELDKAVGEVKQTRDNRYDGGGHQSGRHKTPKAGTQRKQERGTGQDECLPSAFRMDIWKLGTKARRHEKQRIDIGGQVMDGEFMRNVHLHQKNTAIKEASVTHFVEPSVNQGGENESWNEP
jgi:hypothetical protein